MPHLSVFRKRPRTNSHLFVYAGRNTNVKVGIQNLFIIPIDIWRVVTAEDKFYIAQLGEKERRSGTCDSDDSEAQRKMKFSVIVTTYNSAEWLEKVIWGYMHQRFRNFELLIADDGSTSETADLIHSMERHVSFDIRHIWHEDAGFNKCKILNMAILSASADYIVFSDGDCVPRNDFLQTHYANMRPGWFLSGGVVRLPMTLSKGINRDDIALGSAFDKDWLHSHGLRRSPFKDLKLLRNKRVAAVLNHVSPTSATWNGGNSSAWKKDILSVNGFDESMHYGAEDREFGERLINRHVFGLQVRYSAVCIHLDHTRDYMNEEDLKRNKEKYQHTRSTKSRWTSCGIIKSEEPRRN